MRNSHEDTKARRGGGITTPGGEIILYQRGDSPAIGVRLDGDTVWLSQQQLADLFQTSRTNVVEHISNIYTEGELSQEATCREFRQVRSEGTREVARTLPLYFDAAEFRALNHEPTCMKDWLAHLGQLIAAMGGKALQGAGKVSHQQALTHAETEFERYRSQQDALPSEVETAYLETLKTVQKKVEGKP